MLKKYYPLKIIFVLFFSLVLSFLPLPQRKASAWIDTIIPKVITPPMQTLLDQLEVMLTGALQQAAIKMITENVYTSISGGSGSGGTKFIVNWKTALVTNPKKTTALYIEQLTKSSTRGKGGSSYEPASNSSVANFEGVGKEGLAQYFRSPRFIDSASAQEASDSSEDYTSTLQELGQNIADEITNESPCTITYEGSPDDMFDDGTFKNFSKFISGVNNPWSYATCIENAAEENLEENKAVEEAQAIAYQGFKGSGSDGNISYPGSAVAAKLFNVENMGNEVIVNADGIAKVITSIVMKMGMDAINNGIGNVQEQTQKNISNTSDKSNAQTQNQVDNFGPGAVYGNSSDN